MNHYRSLLPTLRASLAGLLFASATAVCAGHFFESDGVAIRGFDPVSYQTEQRAVRGKEEFRATHEGSEFRFSTSANRDAFVASPQRYAPQYGGFCAFGTAGGYKAATDPMAFTIVNGKLYLNYNEQVRKEWGKDIPGYIEKADKNWPVVQTQTKVAQ